MSASLFSDASLKLEAGPRLRTLVAERIRLAIANNRSTAQLERACL
jgi:hypothetical protein